LRSICQQAVLHTHYVGITARRSTTLGAVTTETYPDLLFFRNRVRIPTSLPSPVFILGKIIANKLFTAGFLLSIVCSQSLLPAPYFRSKPHQAVFLYVVFFICAFVLSSRLSWELRSVTWFKKFVTREKDFLFHMK